MKQELDEIRKAIEKAIPSAAAEVARYETGKRAIADFAVTMDFKGIHLELMGEWIGNPSTAIVRDKVDQLRRVSEAELGIMPLLMAPYFTESQRKLLAEAGVAFIDLDGNAHIEGEGVYISRVSKPSGPRKVSAPNPFSDKASLVARQLLVRRDPVGVRELSSLIGLTPGYVSKVLSRLDSLGYLSKGEDEKMALRDPKSLLQDWAAVYDYTKSRTTGYFCRARSADDIIDRLKRASIQAEHALTAQAGAHLIAPYAAFDRVDIYSAGPSATAELVSRLGLEPVSKGANVLVWNPYYKYSVFFGSREVEGVRVVSDIQLYLDLVKYPLRGPEQAEHLYETLLKPMVERDA